MNTSTHPNSKQVTIFRTKSFIEGAQGADAADYMAMAKMSIGSYWESINSHKIGSGLDFEEEELLLPIIVDTPVEDKEFRKKVSEFYKDINTPVPYAKGTPLEVGLRSDNERPVAKDNMPLNIMDYLRYRHAMGHPEVSMSKDEGEGNQTKKYYIFDKDTVQNKSAKSRKEKDAAMQIYLKVKNEPEQVDQLLTLLGVDIRDYEGQKEAVDLKMEKLHELSEANPVLFKEKHSLGDLDIRAWITNMANVGVLKNVGPRYLDGETSDVFGNNMDEAIMNFKDPAQSGVVTALKARYQEATRTKKKAAVKRTVIA